MHTTMNQILHTYPLEHPAIRQVTFHQWGAILACQNTSSGRDTQPYRGCETEKTYNKPTYYENNEYNGHNEKNQIIILPQNRS